MTSTSVALPNDMLLLNLDAKSQNNEVNKQHTKKTRKTAEISCCGRNLSHDALLIILTIAGVALGFLIGILVAQTNPSKDAITLIMFPGEMLMRMLKMMIIPIIITSVITGLASLDMSKSGKLGTHAAIYYLSTTTLAAFLGIILVTAIQPGSSNPLDIGKAKADERPISTMDTFLDLIRNTFPDNIIAACFQVAQTQITEIKITNSQEIDNANTTLNSTASLNSLRNVTNSSEYIIEYSKKLVKEANPNILGIILFCVFFGITLASLKEEGKPVALFFSTLNKIFMKMITVVIWYSPIGICSLIAGNLLKMKGVEELFSTIGLYMVTVIVGLVVHVSIILPIIYYAMTRKNPFKFYFGCSQAALTALGTGSSAGTLPVTMRCLETNLKIDRRVTQFVLPLGATMNMDGTALLEGVAAITIAQMYQYTLNFGQIITISVTATLASIGAAAIPSAGLVTLLLVLSAIGIPTEAVGLLWSIDWFLDRLRTVVNVLGDCVGAGIVQHLNRYALEEPILPLDDASESLKQRVLLVKSEGDVCDSGLSMTEGRDQSSM